MDALDSEAVAAVAGDRPNKVTMDALDSDADAAAAAARDQPNTLTKDAVDFADFDAVVGDLMLKHGVQESDLLERMRNISKAASKDLAEDLPPLQVLYNNCYGGFRYSYAFQKAFILQRLFAFFGMNLSWRVSEVQWKNGQG